MVSLCHTNMKKASPNSLYKPDEICLNGKTSLFNRDQLEERKRLLKKSGFRSLFFWECQVHAQKTKDTEMAKFFDEQEEQVGPLFPRDAFQVYSHKIPLHNVCDREEGQGLVPSKRTWKRRVSRMNMRFPTMMW
jgi:hypothetical protein